MSQRRSLAIYVSARASLSAAQKLRAELPHSTLFVLPDLWESAPPGAQPLQAGDSMFGETFAQFDCHVVLGSVPLAVRQLTRLQRGALTTPEPAVVCADVAAQLCVCLQEGGLLRGMAFCQRAARALGMRALLTAEGTADDSPALPIEALGREFGWSLDHAERAISRACAALQHPQKRVVLVQETGEPHFWPLHEPLPHHLAYTTALDGLDAQQWDALLLVSDRDIRLSHPQLWHKAVIYRPKSLVLGLSCDRHTPLELIERGVASLLARRRLNPRSIKALATIEAQSGEAGLTGLSQRHGWPLHLFADAELRAVAQPTAALPRGPRVAEPAALLAAEAQSLLADGQTYGEPGSGHTVCMAIARVPFAARQTRRMAS